MAGAAEEPIANAEVAAAWGGAGGEAWARDARPRERAVRGHHLALLAAAAIAPGERVLDVGCGTGESTLDAARAASPDGWALGVDLSPPLLDVARRAADEAGLHGVRFERADAQVHPFGAAAFDVAMSRFGTMFFADPVAAFANVGAAVRPGGRLAMVVWRGVEAGGWLDVMRAAVEVVRPVPVPAVGAPGPLGLADPDRTRAVLAASGWVDVDVAAVDVPYVIGGDEDEAFAYLRDQRVLRGMAEGLDDDGRARVHDALRAAVAAHRTADDVRLPSGSWLVTGRRPG